MLRHLIILLAAVASMAGCGHTPQALKLPQDVAEAYKQLPDKLDYNIHVKPILADKCFACHGPDKAKQKAGLRLDIPGSAYGPLPESPGKTAIVPGARKVR